VLEKLKLEAEADGSHAKIRRIDLYDRSSPNVRSDQPLSWAISSRSMMLSAWMSMAGLLAI
jgi:hypothetical protein